LRIGFDYKRAHSPPRRKQGDRSGDGGASNAAFAKYNDDAMAQKTVY
jgi:hypothetical protein